MNYYYLSYITIEQTTIIRSFQNQTISVQKEKSYRQKRKSKRHPETHKSTV